MDIATKTAGVIDFLQSVGIREKSGSPNLTAANAIEDYAEMCLRSQPDTFDEKVEGIYSPKTFYNNAMRTAPDLVDVTRVPSSDVGADLIVRHGENRISLVQVKGYGYRNKCDGSPFRELLAAKSRYSAAGWVVTQMVVATTAHAVTAGVVKLVESTNEEEGGAKFSYLVLSDMAEAFVPSSVNHLVESLSSARPDGAVSPRANAPLPHQVKHIFSIIRAFIMGAVAATFISPCGTGKTLVFAEILRALWTGAWGSRFGMSGYAVFGVPSRSLAIQTARALRDQLGELVSIAFISHDSALSRKSLEDGEISHEELRRAAKGSPVFGRSNPGEIAMHEARVRAESQARVAAGLPPVRLVFVTVYDSAGAIEVAQREFNMPTADIADGDECHHLVVPGGASPVGGRESFLNGIQATFRLYGTATPRCSSRAREGAVGSVMGDGIQFGDVVSEYTVREAVKDGVLSPVEFAVTHVAEPSQLGSQKDGRIYPISGMTDDAGRQLFVSLNVYCAVISVGMLYETGVRVMGVYAATIEESDEIARIIAAKYRIRSASVHSKRSTDENNANIAHANTKEAQRDGFVLVNVRVLTEGVDIPALQAVIFAHPTGSQITAVQIMGRPMRPHETKTSALLVFPVLVETQVVSGVGAAKTINAVDDADRRYWALVSAARAINSGRSIQDIMGEVKHIRTTSPDGRVGGSGAVGEEDEPAPAFESIAHSDAFLSRLASISLYQVMGDQGGDSDLVSMFCALLASLWGTDPETVLASISSDDLDDSAGVEMRSMMDAYLEGGNDALVDAVTALIQRPTMMIA